MYNSALNLKELLVKVALKLNIYCTHDKSKYILIVSLKVLNYMLTASLDQLYFFIPEGETMYPMFASNFQTKFQ